MKTLLGFSIAAGLMTLGAWAAAQAPGIPRPAPVDPDLVSVRVTVNAALQDDPLPRLERRRFRVSEEGVEQEIASFNAEQGALSAAMLYSVAQGSDLRGVPKAFLESLPKGSEYFLMVGDTVTIPFNTDPARLPRNFRPEGGSVEDVFIGLDVLKESAYPRRALLIVTDGVSSPPDIEYYRSHAIRQSVPVYMVLMSDDPGGFGAIALEEMTVLTGGLAYFGPSDAGGAAENYIRMIAQGLRNQYTIGYRSKNRTRDGKWRRIEVSVESPEGGPKLNAKARSGYYARKGAVSP